jgi:hypothetical protein
MSDFTNVIDITVALSAYEEDTGVDFVPIGDGGTFVTEGEGWGEDPWGSGPWGGGEDVVIIGNPVTLWTNIETP